MDVFAVVANEVEHFLVGWQILVLLFVVTDLHRFANVEAATVGRSDSGQHIQQRRFSDAVGADDADAVVFHEGVGEIAKNRPPVIAFREVLAFDDFLAQARVHEIHQQRVVVFVGELAFQLVETFFARFLLGASCLYTLAHPGQLLLVKPAHFVGVAGLYGFTLCLFFEKGGIVAAVAVEFSTIKFENDVGGAVKKIAVVGDDDETRLTIVQLFLQPADGLVVEMVCRFVQQEQVGRANQRRRQRHTLLHAAGKGADFLGHVVDAQTVQNAFGVRLKLPGIGAVHGILGGEQRLRGCRIVRVGADGGEGFFVMAHHRKERRISLKNLRQHGECVLHWLVLRQIFHHQLVGRENFALWVQLDAGELRQQGRFADAIGADETDFVALIHTQPQIIKQYALANACAQMAGLQKNHGNSP